MQKSRDLHYLQKKSTIIIIYYYYNYLNARYTTELQYIHTPTELKNNKFTKKKKKSHNTLLCWVELSWVSTTFLLSSEGGIINQIISIQ